jgi:hypothetical protein
MIRDKLKYKVPEEISEQELSFVQNYISELCDDDMLEDCTCNQIRVFVFDLTPIRSHFSARFECDCGKERSDIYKKLIDF